MRVQANPLDVSRDSSVTIVIRLLAGQPRKRGVIHGRDKRKCLGRPWGTPNIVSNDRRGLYF